MSDLAQEWFQPLIWTDYRVALVFLAIVPAILLIWALVQRTEVIQTSLIVYWRVASLFAIGLYLAIGGASLSFPVLIAAKLLIPLSLWFWVDVNEEVADLAPRPLKSAYNVWRWAVTLYCLVSAVASSPFLSCAVNAGATKTSYCQAWFQPPWLYHQFFHANSKPEFLSMFGSIALGIYGLYLVYFLVVRLTKQGRSAMQE
jgi:hypothetical protein